VESQSKNKSAKFNLINFTPAAGCHLPSVSSLASDARISTILLPGFLNPHGCALVVSLCTKTNRVLKHKALSNTDNLKLDIAGQADIGRHTISFPYISRKEQKPFYMRTAWRNAGLIPSNLVSYLFYRKGGL
jgi:hypothetical protein